MAFYISRGGTITFFTKSFFIQKNKIDKLLLKLCNKLEKLLFLIKF